MQVADFAEKYNININSLYVTKSQGALPHSIFTKAINSKKDDIDETYFLRRWEFIKKVKHRNQDLYYLLAEYFTVVDISKEIARLYGGNHQSIGMYIANGLFSVSSDSNITKVSKIAWKMHRYWWSLEKKLRRRGTSIEKILDKRMNDAEEVA